MKQVIDKNGYYRFGSETGRLVHRDTWFAANKASNKRWHVHHINGKKRDNRLENLILLDPTHHHLLHQKWPINSLPGRSAIIAWMKELKLGRVRNRKPKQRRLAKSEIKNHERTVCFPFQVGRVVLPVKPIPVFKPRIIVRKASA